MNQRLANGARKARFLLSLAGTPSTLRLAAAHLAARCSGLRPPEAATMALTGACNLNCRHCAVDGSRPDAGTISLASAAAILDELRDMLVPRVYFGGGEPLLHPDIIRIIGRAAERGFVSFLETNGFLLDRKTAGKLRTAGLSCACVSLHGPNGREHDEFSGRRGSFERALAAMNACAGVDLPCLASIVARQELSPVLPAMIGTARTAGCRAVRLTMPRGAGKWRVARPETASAASILVKDHGLAGFDRTTLPSCTIGQTLYITPSGKIQPCEFIPYSFGDALSDGTVRVLRRMRVHPMFRAAGQVPCRADDAAFREKYLIGLKTGDIPVEAPDF